MAVRPSSSPDVHRAPSGARPISFWLDDARRPAALPSLKGPASTDLAVVGGGYTGLWTALLAKEAEPAREVMLIEGERVGWAASGRNGGFVNASLTHGYENGARHLPDELAVLERMGRENLDEIEAAVSRYAWDCDFERTGGLSVATQPYQAEQLRGEDGYLDAAAVRAEVDSPTYLAGVLDTGGTALVNPARLAWELRRTCLERGVRIVEHTTVSALRSDRVGVHLQTPGGVVHASRVALGTNAFPALLRRYRLHTIPVYDYALMTEPLTGEQRQSIGWHGRQGLDDLGNQFHYYRLSADDRILFGGYDAVYHHGRALRPEYDHRPETYRRLAEHFFQTFPQLADVRFSHAWGGAVDTCTRFFAFFGTGHGGRVAHAAGFTGLGVAATRFAAEVLLDLLSGQQTERTTLRMVRHKPLPFPPEPLAWLGVQATTASLGYADRHQGRRNLWLRALDAAGVGFDS